MQVIWSRQDLRKFINSANLDFYAWLADICKNIRCQSWRYKWARHRKFERKHLKTLGANFEEEFKLCNGRNSDEIMFHHHHHHNGRRAEIDEMRRRKLALKYFSASLIKSSRRSLSVIFFFKLNDAFGHAYLYVKMSFYDFLWPLAKS